MQHLSIRSVSAQKDSCTGGSVHDTPRMHAEVVKKLHRSPPQAILASVLVDDHSQVRATSRICALKKSTQKRIMPSFGNR